MRQMGAKVGKVERSLIVRVPVWNAKIVGLYLVPDEKAVVLFKLWNDKCVF